ncbi:MAG: hypothetical protein EA350_10560 [Gemmatimonadales bacterium]|nr:MAG: hypothetical protein EA350_10560 [Gemmatimonadales bacterium]
MSTTHEPLSVYALAENPEPTTEVWISRTGTEWRLLDTWDAEREDDGPWLQRARAQLPSSDGSVPYLFVTLFATVDGFVTYRYSINWQPE